MLKDEKVREALEPCPRCGNRAFIAHGNTPSVNGYPVWCLTDRCLRLPPRETELEAITDWNTRTPPAQAEASEAEIKRLRGLLIDPGDPAWEDMRGILVAELRKAELPDHAASVAEGGGSYIPSWIALILMATIAKTQAEASTLPGEDRRRKSMVDRGMGQFYRERPALRASEQDVDRVARAIMHAPTRNAKFSDFIHDDEAQSAARAALAAINGETT